MGPLRQETMRKRAEERRRLFLLARQDKDTSATMLLTYKDLEPIMKREDERIYDGFQILAQIAPDAQLDEVIDSFDRVLSVHAHAADSVSAHGSTPEGLDYQNL